MKKQVLYEYLGTNGTILSPIHLEDIYYVRKLRLMSDQGFILKNKETAALRHVVVIPESDFANWEEIEYKGEGQE